MIYKEGVIFLFINTLFLLAKLCHGRRKFLNKALYWSFMENSPFRSCIVVRYSEIALKGKNRVFFEKRLVRNIECCFFENSISYKEIIRKRGRIFIFFNREDSCFDYKALFRNQLLSTELRKVFGISSFSFAIQADADIEIMKKAAKLLFSRGLLKGTNPVGGQHFAAAKGKPAKSFRARARRIDKSISYNSMEIDRIIGGFIADSFSLPVSLSSPDIELGIEIFESKAYLFTGKIKGFSGLPLGTQGKACFLLLPARLSLDSDLPYMSIFLEQDICEKSFAMSSLSKQKAALGPIGRQQQLLAALLMMKRGVELDIAAESSDVASDFKKALKGYCYGSKPGIVLISSFAAENANKSWPKSYSAFAVPAAELWRISCFRKQLFGYPLLFPLAGFTKGSITKACKDYLLKK